MRLAPAGFPLPPPHSVLCLHCASYRVRRAVARRVGVITNPGRVHRLAQPVAFGDKCYSWRKGACIRLPGNRLLLVHRRPS